MAQETRLQRHKLTFQKKVLQSQAAAIQKQSEAILALMESQEEKDTKSDQSPLATYYFID